MFRVQLKVMPRKGILNPAGSAVTRALGALGYSAVDNLEMGRYMEFIVKIDHLDEAKNYVDEMCKRLLTNPIIEDYTYKMDPVEEE